MKHSKCKEILQPPYTNCGSTPLYPENNKEGLFILFVVQVRWWPINSKMDWFPLGK